MSGKYSTFSPHMAMALLLAGRRKVTQADRYIREGNWVKLGDFEYVRHVNHSKVGIVGLGRIGLEIANRCASFRNRWISFKLSDLLSR